MNYLVTKGSIYYEIVGSGFPILIMHSMGTDHRSMKACRIKSLLQSVF
jgi:hypothetical protein